MNPMRVVILNPFHEATPLNFRTWLRNKLSGYEKAGVVKNEQVTGILFLTKTYKGQVGMKNIEKILAGAIAKRSWLSAIEIITTQNPISDDDAEAFLAEVQSNYRVEEQLRQLDDEYPAESHVSAEVTDTFLGYKHPSLSEPDLDGVAHEPDCVLRKARPSDFNDALKGAEGFAEGDWFVFGASSESGSVELSQPLADEIQARLYAREKYGSLVFKTPVEIQAEQMRHQVDALVS